MNINDINKLTPEQIALLIEENNKLKQENTLIKYTNKKMKVQLTRKDKSLAKKNEIINNKENIINDKITQIEEIKKEKEQIEAQFNYLNKKYDKLLKKYEAKMHIIKLNNHNVFSTKKEDSNEPIVINEAEEKCKKKRGRPQGSKNFESLDLESMVCETIVNDSKKICEECGGTMNKIRDDISYKIESIPASYKVIKIITPIFVCSSCKRIVQANSKSIYNHSACTPSLAANIINAKYDLGVPLYRYSKYLNDRNIPLSTMDLSNYVISTDELLKPIYNALKSSLINTSCKVIFADETPLEVLDYAKENKKNGYIFAYVSSFYEHPIYLYDFSKTRETEKTKELLKGFEGYLVCDGYAGYNDIASDKIKIQRCFVHIRRYYYNIVKTLPDKLKASSVAFKMVEKIDRLFHKEAEFVEKKLTATEIHIKRQSLEYQNLLNDVYDYLHNIEAEDGTPLSTAISYFKKLEKESKTFLLDGHIPLSSNLVERAIKPFTILRRNFLFSKTENGANASARLFSILQTAKANGLIPELYFKYILNSIGNTQIDDLLPWSEKIPANIKSNIK